ncbi:MAG TPA: hypothetical protein VEA16_08855 [Vicinamibacterales bacterium]|nr:hypothetical protein [Vicinamibacterales bacterium]
MAGEKDIGAFAAALQRLKHDAASRINPSSLQPEMLMPDQPDPRQTYVSQDELTKRYQENLRNPDIRRGLWSEWVEQQSAKKDPQAFGDFAEWENYLRKRVQDRFATDRNAVEEMAHKSEAMDLERGKRPDPTRIQRLWQDIFQAPDYLPSGVGFAKDKEGRDVTYDRDPRGEGLEDLNYDQYLDWVKDAQLDAVKQSQQGIPGRGPRGTGGRGGADDDPWGLKRIPRRFLR